MNDDPAPFTDNTTAPAQDGCYLYCIVPLLDLSGLNLYGLDDANVYQIAFRDLGAVVHDCPAVPYAGEREQAEAWLLAHHNVIDKVWEQAGTVLPLTFDAIIAGGSGQQARERVIAWLEENYESFRDKLEELQDKVELIIQVNWDRTAALQEILTTDKEIGQLQEEMQGKSKGTAFFYQQKIEKLLRQKADARVEEVCQAYLQRIQGLAAQTFVNMPKRLDGPEMLLNLSVLMDREKISAIGSVLGELEARQGITIRFTGPWPPYSFTMKPQTSEKADCSETPPNAGGGLETIKERGENVEERKTSRDIILAMLRLAGRLENEGRLHEACELYFKILDSAVGMSEAETAREALLAIAYDYERKGLVHMALDLYEKLS